MPNPVTETIAIHADLFRSIVFVRPTLSYPTVTTNNGDSNLSRETDFFTRRLTLPLEVAICIQISASKHLFIIDK
jgi:hypothetical protein